MQTRWQYRSTLLRAVLPVVGGLGFFALLALATWGIAAVLANNPERVEQRLAETQFEVGRTQFLAGSIADDGPLLFQGLVGDDAARSIVLDHTGDVVGENWRVRYAYPADRDDTCLVEQVKGTAQFVDCDGRTLSVDDLARPTGVKLFVSDVVVIDLRGAVSDTGEPTSATTP